MAGTPSITFIEQATPVDQYGHALSAVARSAPRALLDSISSEDLGDRLRSRSAAATIASGGLAIRERQELGPRDPGC